MYQDYFSTDLEVAVTQALTVKQTGDYYSPVEGIEDYVPLKIVARYDSLYVSCRKPKTAAKLLISLGFRCEYESDARKVRVDGMRYDSTALQGVVFDALTGPEVSSFGAGHYPIGYYIGTPGYNDIEMFCADCTNDLLVNNGDKTHFGSEDMLLAYQHGDNDWYENEYCTNCNTLIFTKNVLTSEEQEYAPFVEYVKVGGLDLWNELVLFPCDAEGTVNVNRPTLTLADRDSIASVSRQILELERTEQFIAGTIIPCTYESGTSYENFPKLNPELEEVEVDDSGSVVLVKPLAFTN